MDRSLESLKAAFSEWRASKQNRFEAIPAHLWTWVCEIISDTGVHELGRLAGVLSINVPKTREKFTKYTAEHSLTRQAEESKSSPEKVSGKKDTTEFQECSEYHSQKVEHSSGLHTAADEEPRMMNSRSFSRPSETKRHRRAKGRRRVHVTRLMLNGASDDYRQTFLVNDSIQKDVYEPAANGSAISRAEHASIGTPKPEPIAVITLGNVVMSVTSNVSQLQLVDIFVGISNKISSHRMV